MINDPSSKNIRRAYQSRFRGLGFLDSYTSTHALADINEAVSAFTEAVSCTPDNHERLPGHLNGLGVSLRHRFEATGDLTDISASISALQKAVELTLDSDPDKPFWLYDLGTSLMLRFVRTKRDIGDISASISAQQRAVALSPAGSPSIPLRLNSLGISLTRRFEHTEDLADISEAISVQQRAIRLSFGNENETLAHKLNALGNSLMRRFQYTGNLTDISQSIVFQYNAINHIPETDTNTLCPWLDNLGIALTLKFLRTGNLDNISESISAHRRALELYTDGHPNLPAILHHLGGSLMHRFVHTEQLTDISESISVQQQAVQLLPENHAWLPSFLDSSGSSLMRRFDRTGHVSDINEAISLQRKAVNLAPEDHARLPSRLNNLANSLRTRFQRTRHLGDISEAIAFQKKAVQLTPETHADLPTWLSNLGVFLSDYFHHTNDITFLSEAIVVQHKAVQLMPEDHSRLTARLNNLGNALFSQYQHTQDINDLAEAISVQQRAIRQSPENHPDLPVVCNNLGRSLQARFERLKNNTDIQEALSNYQRAATFSFGSLTQRLWGAQKWARLSKQDPSQALEAWHMAIDLASQVAGLEYTIQERYAFLVDISDLSTSAAAAAFEHGQPSSALEWLEQGRCLVWRQVNNLRTPLDLLRNHNASLADELARVSRALEVAANMEEASPFTGETSMTQKMSMQSEALAHVRFAQRWDELLKEVRSMPGFEDFLRPPPCSVLVKHLPKSGPVVFVNVQEDRCDALALNSGDDTPLHIPLPEFSYNKAHYLRQVLAAHLRDNGLRERGSELNNVERGMRPERKVARSSSVMKEVLRQLWDFVVRPVLNGLGFNDLSDHDSIKRIWWCATGPISFLPIHAAGLYDGVSSTSLLDFATSSYIPSLTVLKERLRGPRDGNPSKMGLLMISQPDTPGQRPIPGTTQEVRAIEDLLRTSNVRHLCLDQAAGTFDNGIKQMGLFDCVHLACHASQNSAEPLKSAFYLHDRPLQLSAIIKQNLVHADLAYLGACQTSTGDQKLSEEAVHLAAGMLAAGYRGVIATMWSISDSVAPKIARHFYSKIIADAMVGADGKRRVSGEFAANALHYAVREVRKELKDTEENLLAWIPYVHFGA
ncbi:hypothetical protein CVT26_013021 [Gymnopilus dilepis]|uniref:CHAT domain-containing protein n=1 Tax=Gymnopilus dilepis TaxID=231916 RepID=A0A409Y4F1_9AGAR|nr:hypothetical protein CVT26_013021 [Gymnopilus dilepis]